MFTRGTLQSLQSEGKKTEKTLRTTVNNWRDEERTLLGALHSSLSV